MVPSFFKYSMGPLLDPTMNPISQESETRERSALSGYQYLKKHDTVLYLSKLFSTKFK